jgi:hypothetical protein
MKKDRRLRALLWFLLWCAFFSLAFTPVYWLADSLLLAALIALLVVSTGKRTYQLWKYRSIPEMRQAIASAGQGGIFSARWRRWTLDEHSDDSN